jgi:dolichol-phosphate mannosyltransferase
VDISIVIPVLNEEENIEPLCESASTVMQKLGCTYEIILVDDGSDDATWKEIGRAAEKDRNIRAIGFPTRFGQTSALAAGFHDAQGEVVIAMDGDLQNDPEDIPALLEKLKEGFDVVSGWRKHRRDPYLTRTLPSSIANGIISWVTGIKLHDYGCTLKAYRRDCVKEMNLYGEMHRFIPAYAAWQGRKVTEIEVRHHPRRSGRSKYGVLRTFKVVLDVLSVKLRTHYSSKPLYFFGTAGMASSLLGLAAGIAAIVLKVTGLKTFVSTPLPLLSVFLILMGVQLVFMGLLAEMLQGAYQEISKKAPYEITRRIG